MSFEESYDQPLASTIAVGDSGSSLPTKAKTDLVAIVVSEDLDAPSMFTMEFNNWDGADVNPPWSDDTKTFIPGQKVAISLGYVDEETAVLQGEITSIEPIFRPTPSTMVVRGYDLRHRLLRGRKTLSFTNVTDDAIAVEIAKNASINQVKAQKTSVTHEYVLQHNQTDFDFLQERARRIGFELFMIGTTLQFRPRPINAKEAVTLKLGRDLLEFTPRLTTMSQVSEVTVQGWDVKKKEAIVSTAALGKETAAMGSTIGAKTANGAFGKSTQVYVNQPISTQAEADQIAAGKFNEMALSYIKGEGICYGRPDLKAGTVVKIEGVGDKFSGLYYITATKHIWQKGSNTYRTRFSYRRNAS
jgi:phage protein D